MSRLISLWRSNKLWKLFASKPSLWLLLGLAAASYASAQTPDQVAKQRELWDMSDQQRADRMHEAHSLELDWSHGMWVVRNPLFFSSYKNVDDLLSGRKAPDGPPLTPDYQAKADALREEGKKNRAAVDTGALVEHLKTMGLSFNQDPNFVPLKAFDVTCPLYGYPLELIEPNAMKWDFGTTKIMQYFSGSAGISRLIKYGGALSGWKGNFRWPATTIPDGQGWAYAHWEGNVLTIEVSHVSWWYEQESGYVLEVGAPHSEKLTATEKWWQVGPNELHLEVTLRDPDALTKPWVVNKVFDRIDSNEVINRQCH